MQLMERRNQHGCRSSVLEDGDHYNHRKEDGALSTLKRIRGAPRISYENRN